MILGHLTEQVLPEEVGALQGAAVTTHPLTSHIHYFLHTISFCSF